MSKEKQIEEMAKILHPDSCFDGDITACRKMEECSICHATKLYNAGYRKQSENVIELPCKEGDTVYVLRAEDTECHLGVVPSEYACQGCEERECDSVRTYHIRELSNINKWTILDYLWQKRFGKDVFITKDEAEKALAKMKGGAE